MSLQHGKNQELIMTSVDTGPTERSYVLKQVENISKGLSFLIEHVGFQRLNESYAEEMELILNLAEELDNKLTITQERTEMLDHMED